jgi:hypothetical protein
MKFYGIKAMNDADSWAEFVKPGKFKAGKSAYSLAHTWQPANGFPSSVTAVLAPRFQLTPKRAFIEWEEALDTAKAPSTTDIMVDAEDSQGNSVPVGVEGKCSETFAEPIHIWVRDAKMGETTLGAISPKPTRERRLEFLNETLGTAFDVNSTLRYQLVHRTASVVLRARCLGATSAVMLVHSFVVPGSQDPNFADWGDFLKALPTSPTGTKGTLIGSVSLGGVDMFFAWVEDHPVGGRP